MKDFFFILRAFWVVWIWKPLKNRANEIIGAADCCDDPDWIWQEGHGFSIRICTRCHHSRTYPRNF